jgi:hypothetical protein
LKTGLAAVLFGQRWLLRLGALADVMTPGGRAGNNNSGTTLFRQTA